MKARKKSDIGLEQYFTPQSVADRLAESMIQIVGEEAAMTQRWLEPSAGAGAFIEALVKHGVPLDHIDAFDLEPRHPHIQQADFLEIASTLTGPYLTIGNPPYGHRSELAVRFFNTCAARSLYVGFITPRNWRGPTLPRRLHPKFHSIYDAAVSAVFQDADGEDSMAVRSCFQVWKASEQRRVDPDCEDRMYWITRQEEADLILSRFSLLPMERRISKQDIGLVDIHPLVLTALEESRRLILLCDSHYSSSVGGPTKDLILATLNQWFDEHPEEKAIVHAAIEAKKRKSLFDDLP